MCRLSHASFSAHGEFASGGEHATGDRHERAGVPHRLHRLPVEIERRGIFAADEEERRRKEAREGRGTCEICGAKDVPLIGSPGVNRCEKCPAPR